VACEGIAVGMMAGALFSDRLWSKSFWLLWILLAWTISSEHAETERSTSIRS
jgi:hypothetical protein